MAPPSKPLLCRTNMHHHWEYARVRPRLTDWSLNCFTSPLDAPAMRRRELPRRYVSGDGDQYPAKTTFGPIADQAEADGCRVDRLATGHDVMLEAPKDVADITLTSSR